MDLLKRQNWWVWLIIYLGGSGFLKSIILGYFLKVFDPNEWYAKWWVWVIGFVAFIFPFFVMIMVFYFQITVAIADRLNVGGKTVYGNTYFWILGVIIPIIGWAFIGFLILYLHIFIFIQLYSGEGEQYIEA